MQRAIEEANRAPGACVYAPSLTGHYGRSRAAALARDAGVRMVLVAPMVSGVARSPSWRAEPRAGHGAPGVRRRRAHRAAVLLGKLFRLFGADATIFPNDGGRFSYSPATCRAIADAARAPWHGLTPALPVPAGGMTVARVPEMRARYGTTRCC